MSVMVFVSFDIDLCLGIHSGVGFLSVDIAIWIIGHTPFEPNNVVLIFSPHPQVHRRIDDTPANPEHSDCNQAVAHFGKIHKHRG